MGRATTKNNVRNFDHTRPRGGRLILIMRHANFVIDDSVPATITSSTLLPWGAPKERCRLPGALNIDPDIRPGEFVMRTLFAEFTQAVDKKVAAVMADPLEKPLAKSLQRGEDAHFDQVIPSDNEGEERTSFQIAT